MNTKENLTCKYCKHIFKEPITLNCCGDSICKKDLNELTSINSSNVFSCPFCNEQILNQKLKVSKTIQDFLDVEVHKFELNPKYENILSSFKTEIGNLEASLRDNEWTIYEQINQVKKQIDLDRESLKSKIDTLADDLIQQLESYEKKFRTEYNVNEYRSLVEASKQQLAEYEKCLNLFSSRAEDMAKQSEAIENAINNLQFKAIELRDQSHGSLKIEYSSIKTNKNKLLGELKIKVNFFCLIKIYSSQNFMQKF
jgi:hypothetical protein